jgi:ABC-type branched-subunit amino acid transport system substrate-binding protein
MVHGITRRGVLKGIGIAGATSVTGAVRAQNAGRTLRQGVLQPLTGGLGSLGVPIKDAALLPAVQLEGQTDFTVETQVADTQTDPNAGQTAARNLVNAGFPAITGAASSEVTIQVARNILIPNNVLGCSPASTSPAITDLRDNDLVWRTTPTDRLQGQVLAQVARDRIQANTAATMYVNNSYGQLLSESFATAFRNADGAVQNQVSFQKGQSSYSAQLRQALQGNPDTMLVIGYPESGVQLFRDYYSDFGGDLPILVTDGLRERSLPSDVANAMSNVRGTAPLAAGPGQEFFTDLFREEYGNEPGVFTAQAYDATAVCLLANAAAGENSGPAIAAQTRAVSNPAGGSESTAGGNETESGTADGAETFTPENLAGALEAAASGQSIDYQGASSRITFDENGDLRTATYELFGFRSGGGIRRIDTVQFGG